MCFCSHEKGKAVRVLIKNLQQAGTAISRHGAFCHSHRRYWPFDKRGSKDKLEYESFPFMKKFYAACVVQLYGPNLGQPLISATTLIIFSSHDSFSSLIFALIEPLLAIGLNLKKIYTQIKGYDNLMGMFLGLPRIHKRPFHFPSSH